MKVYQMSALEVAWQLGTGTPAELVARQVLPVAATPSVTVTAPVHSSLRGAGPQGLGVQEVAGLDVPEQAAGRASVQQPLAVQQAVAVGQGLGVQVVTPSVKTAPVAVQPPAERMVQVPVVVQHEPTLAQGLGSQTVPAPLKVLVVTEQPLTVEEVQAPVVLLQHAPRSAVQGLGVQVVAPSVKMLVLVQPPRERMVQVPVVVQHEPTLAQGLGSQTVPAPLKMLGEAQPPAVVVVHAPVVLLQQAPSRAVQGFVGPQTVPTPWKALVPVQAVASVIEQVPVLEQHAPARVGPHATAVVQEAPSITVSVNGAGTVVAVNVLTRM